MTEKYNEAEVKLRMLILLTHMFDQDMMDDVQFSYWRQLVRDAEADSWMDPLTDG